MPPDYSNSFQTVNYDPLVCFEINLVHQDQNYTKNEEIKMIRKYQRALHIVRIAIISWQVYTQLPSGIYTRYAMVVLTSKI
jgi:hypothetical protein